MSVYLPVYAVPIVVVVFVVRSCYVSHSGPASSTVPVVSVGTTKHRISNLLIMIGFWKVTILVVRLSTSNCDKCGNYQVYNLKIMIGYEQVTVHVRVVSVMIGYEQVTVHVRVVSVMIGYEQVTVHVHVVSVMIGYEQVTVHVRVVSVGTIKYNC